MAIIRGKLVILFTVDTDNYPIPADGRLMLQIKEDVQDILESNIDITVNKIIPTGAVGKHEEIRDND